MHKVRAHVSRIRRAIGIRVETNRFLCFENFTNQTNRWTSHWTLSRFRPSRPHYVQTRCISILIEIKKKLFFNVKEFRVAEKFDESERLAVVGGGSRGRRIFDVGVLNERNVRCRGIWDTTIAGCKHEDTAFACKHSRAVNPFLDFGQILRHTTRKSLLSRNVLHDLCVRCRRIPIASYTPLGEKPGGRFEIPLNISIFDQPRVSLPVKFQRCGNSSEYFSPPRREASANFSGIKTTWGAGIALPGMSYLQLNTYGTKLTRWNTIKKKRKDFHAQRSTFDITFIRGSILWNSIIGIDTPW